MTHLPEEYFENRFQKGSGHGAEVPRPDRGDVRRGGSRAADHRPRHRLQAVHRRPDPLDGRDRKCSASTACSRRRASGAIIPWDWIVDETRELERVSTWDDPAAYARTVARSYRRDFWNQQPAASRCGARRAPCAACSQPVLDQYARRLPRRCTASAARPRSTTSPQDDDGRRSDRRSTSATSIRAACSCRSRTCPTGSPNTAAITSTLKRIALTREQVQRPAIVPGGR